MEGFYNDMTASARKKWDLLNILISKCSRREKDLLPKELPTFVGGTLQVSIIDCLKYLFRKEEDALDLLLETHSEMEERGELPCPEHMRPK